MPGLFDNYRVAVLDASFFTGEFSKSVQRDLENVKIYVADTFSAEVDQYKAVLPKGKRAVYDANIAFINQTKQLVTLNLESFGEQGKGLHNDTWGLLKLLASLNAKFVLITADKLLIQRVVLHDLRVDIYDLDHNTFLRCDDFPLYQDIFELSGTEQDAHSAQKDVRVTEKGKLYRRNGDPVVLGKEIKSGLEANLYLVEEKPNQIVKVFKKGRLSENKYRNIVNIQNMNKILDITWALFPIDLVFYDPECVCIAGFTETFAETSGNLDDNPLYLGEINLADEYLNTRVSASLELCIKIVRQVRYLNSFGFLVSDFNMANFALHEEKSNCIQMWDTDSFGYGNFFSGYCADDATSREYDISKKTGAMEFCQEALYAFVFTTLSLGDAAISEKGRKFKYDKPNYHSIFRKNFFPENLWNLFLEVFRGEKEPSAEVLLQQLCVALQRCRDYPATDKTYKELLPNVDDVADDEGDKEKDEAPPPPPNWFKIALIGSAAIGLVLYLLSNL